MSLRREARTRKPTPGLTKGIPGVIFSLFRSYGARPHSLLLPFPLLTTGDNVFVTTDHMGEPMPLNTVVQSLQVTLTEYNVKMSEQSKVRAFHPPRGKFEPFLYHFFKNEPSLIPRSLSRKTGMLRKLILSSFHIDRVSPKRRCGSGNIKPFTTARIFQDFPSLIPLS